MLSLLAYDAILSIERLEDAIESLLEVANLHNMISTHRSLYVPLYVFSEQFGN